MQVKSDVQVKTETSTDNGFIQSDRKRKTD
jgi:hypothetical protein